MNDDVIKPMCPGCGSFQFYERIQIDQVRMPPVRPHGKSAIIDVKVPVLNCRACKTRWTDYRAEQIKEKAERWCRTMKKDPDGNVIRQNYWLSSLEPGDVFRNLDRHGKPRGKRFVVLERHPTVRKVEVQSLDGEVCMTLYAMTVVKRIVDVTLDDEGAERPSDPPVGRNEEGQSSVDSHGNIVLW